MIGELEGVLQSLEGVNVRMLEGVKIGKNVKQWFLYIYHMGFYYKLHKTTPS